MVGVKSMTETILSPVEEYTPIFKNHGLSVKVNIPDDAVFMSIDIEKMIRGFDNLLSNE
jgi:hypothetical protein